MIKNFREKFLFFVFISYLFLYFITLTALFLTKKTNLVFFFQGLKSEFRTTEIISFYFALSFIALLYVILKLKTYKNKINQAFFSTLMFVSSFSAVLIKIIIIITEDSLKIKELSLFLNRAILFILISNYFLLFQSSLNLKMGDGNPAKIAIPIIFAIALTKVSLFTKAYYGLYFEYMSIDKNLTYILIIINLMTILNFFVFRNLYFAVRIIILIFSYFLIFFTQSYFFYGIGFVLFLIFLILNKN